MKPMPCISLAMTIVLCIVLAILFYAIGRILATARFESDTAMKVIKNILCLGLWVWLIFGIAYVHPNDKCNATLSFKQDSKWV